MGKGCGIFPPLSQVCIALPHPGKRRATTFRRLLRSTAPATTEQAKQQCGTSASPPPAVLEPHQATQEHRLRETKAFLARGTPGLEHRCIVHSRPFLQRMCRGFSVGRAFAKPAPPMSAAPRRKPRGAEEERSKENGSTFVALPLLALCHTSA